VGRRTRYPVEGGGDGEGREVAAEHLDGEGAGRRRQGCTDGEEEGAAAAGDGCSSHCSPGEEAVELPAALVGGAGEARCSRGAEAAEPVAGDGGVTGGGGCGAMLEGERGGEGRVVGEVVRRAGRRRQDPGDIQRLPGEFLKNRVGRAVRQSNQFRVSTHARTLFVVSRSLSHPVVSRTAGEEGAVRAARPREAAGAGPRAAGAAAGRRHAPPHAGPRLGGAVPPAGASAAARTRVGSSRPPSPRSTPVAAAPQAAQLLRTCASYQFPSSFKLQFHFLVATSSSCAGDGPVRRGPRQGRRDGRRRRAEQLLGGGAGRLEGRQPPRRRVLPPLPVPVPAVLPRAVVRGARRPQPAHLQRPPRPGPAAAAVRAHRCRRRARRAELHGQHGVVPGQGAVAERAEAARHRRRARAGEAAQPAPRQEDDAAVVLAHPVPVPAVGRRQARPVQRLARRQRVRVHNRRRGVLPLTRRVRGAQQPTDSDAHWDRPQLIDDFV
jgi:hypothetical protein